MKERAGEKGKLILAMAIFGTIGIFRKYISYSSGIIAFVRGFVGFGFLSAVLLIQKRKITVKNVKKTGLPLILSGLLLGINWILLFESYRYTEVSIATVCYYTAPLLVVLASPVVLREKLTVKKVICVMVSVFGLALVSKASGGAAEDVKGMLFALAAAVTYAAIMLLNRSVREMEAFDRTAIQLAMATIALAPYLLLTEDMAALKPDAFSGFMLLITGVLHTGIAYSLYFDSIRNLPAQTTALLCYIDPVTAVILSAVFLHERVTGSMAVGIALILGASAVGELEKKP